MKLSAFLFSLPIILSGLTSLSAQDKLDAYIAEHVPATDPAPTVELSVLDEVKGVHPRLVLNQEAFAVLMNARGTDRILDEQLAGVFSAVPSGKINPKSVEISFQNASQALINAFDGPLPKIVMAHGLNPTDASRQALIDMLTIIVETPYWETGGELDSGMTMGAIATLAGLTFDMICDDLDPEFRAKAAQVLFQKARHQYYLGHLKRAPSKVKYWQSDPQNNHRWHRNVGMVSCLLAVADEPGIDAGWMLEKTKEEMDFIMKWFPGEGDNHEGVSYSIFGFAHLAVAVTMMDNVLGTNYTQHPGLRHAWESLVYSYSPEGGDFLSWGDSRNRPRKSLGKAGAFFIGPKLSRDADAQAALIQLYDHFQANRDSPDTSWLMIAFYDPTLKPGQLTNLPLNKFFADVGVAYLRDSWDDDAVILMFKCSPYGGFLLNEFREEGGERRYINVAHDDPDANTFSLYLQGAKIPHGTGYDSPKRTANHNTWLVNGAGQIGEGSNWTQPPNRDLRDFAYPTAWKQAASDVTIIEGEAGNAYPGLERYRRSLVWLPGEYVLILDDLKAIEEARLAWHAVSEKGQFIDPEAGRSAFIRQEVHLPYQILGNQSLRGYIDAHLTKGKDDYKFQSTRYVAQADAVRTATLLNPWNDEKLNLDFAENESGTVTLTVDHSGGTDLWLWQPATEPKTPSLLSGKRGATALIELSSSDQVVIGHE